MGVISFVLIFKNYWAPKCMKTSHGVLHLFPERDQRQGKGTTNRLSKVHDPSSW